MPTRRLLKALASVAASHKLPIAVMNVDAVGSTDSESFAEVQYSAHYHSL